MVGTLANKVQFWESLTSDQCIINAVSGYQLEFDSDPSALFEQPKASQEVSLVEQKVISHEVTQLLKDGMIEKVDDILGQVISPIFLPNKKNCSKRVILTLKKLNTYMKYEHFRLESIHTAMNLVMENAYLASVDLAKAYYSVPISITDGRFLRFWFQGYTYHYTWLPHGLSTAPRVFTKVMRVLFLAYGLADIHQ